MDLALARGLATQFGIVEHDQDVVLCDMDIYGPSFQRIVLEARMA